MAAMVSKPVLGVFSLLMLTLGLVLAGHAGPERDLTAAPGDCVACHRGERVLSDRHRATKGMNLEACLNCHERGTDDTLAGVVPGSHLHQLAGVGCVRCHGSARPPEEVMAETCIACHDTATLAARTANVKPKNPHDSPHYGRDADCNLCHHQHARSENYCVQCHDKWTFRVP